MGRGTTLPGRRGTRRQSTRCGTLSCEGCTAEGGRMGTVVYMGTSCDSLPSKPDTNKKNTARVGAEAEEQVQEDGGVV